MDDQISFRLGRRHRDQRYRNRATETARFRSYTSTGECRQTAGRRRENSVGPGVTDRVIKGWGEGVQLMVKGEKRRFWIPQEIAYNGMAGRPAGMLVFDIELLDMSPSPSTPPADVAAAPADAKKTSSGDRRSPAAAGPRPSSYLASFI